MADISDLLGAFTGDETQAKQQAMLAALRRQQSHARELSSLGAMDSLAGLSDAGKALSNQGQHLTDATQSQMEETEKAPVLRQTMAMNGEKLREMQEANAAADARKAALADETSPLFKTRQALAKRFKLEGAEGAQVGDQELNMGLKATEAEESRAMRLELAQQKAAAGAAAGAAKAEKGDAKLTDKYAKDLDARMSASGARAGNLGTDYARLANAQNLRSIIDQPVVTPQNVVEATAALGKLISGGVVTEATMDAMVPHTAGMDFARKVQYIFGTPHDAGAKKFLEYMGHTADRESANATARMRQERLSRITAHKAYYQQDPEAFKAQAAGYDLTPEDIESAFAGKHAGVVGGQAAAGAAHAANAAGPTHYLVSPDGKQRIAAGPDGKPLPGAKPEPMPQAVASNG